LALRKFTDNLKGPVLQQRLKDYDQAQKFSWLEQFWLDKAYLEWREPTLLNVNWWMQFYDTKAVKFSDTQSESFTDVQLRRAAMFIRGIMEFKSELDSGKLPPETMGKKQIPLCMNQYRFQFGVTRVPTKGKDVIVSEFPATGKEIMVMVQDQIYFVKAASDDGKLLSAKTIYDQLRKVTEDVSRLNEDQEEASIGVLTSEHRDKWSEAYEHLTKLGNENNFKRINDAVFSVSLDSFAAPEDIDASHHIFFHGNAKNRWFDKALQFIFTTNGRAGCNGEHSPSDAIIPTNIVASVLKREEAGELDFDATAAESSEIAIPERLKWKIDKKVEKYIEDAAKRGEFSRSLKGLSLCSFRGY
jgi:carnitine O-acetyltransferase